MVLISLIANLFVLFLRSLSLTLSHTLTHIIVSQNIINETAVSIVFWFCLLGEQVKGTKEKCCDYLQSVTTYNRTSTNASPTTGSTCSTAPRITLDVCNLNKRHTGA